MKNVLEYLEQKNKEQLAIIEEDKNYTYNQLINESKKIGTALVRYIKPRQPVAVLMEKGANTLMAFLGSVYAGGFYCLLNPELPKIRLEKILDKLDSNIIITDEMHIEIAKEICKNKKILEIEELKNEKINEEKLEEIRKQALDVDPLYANFTSGSTGTPKGVVVSHRSVIDFINIFTEKFKITNKDIIGNQAPFDFDVSVKDIYSCLKTGATLVIIPKRLFSRPAELIDYICEKKVTTLIWAVSALCLVTTFHGLDYKVPQSLNKIMFSGEVMPIKHLKTWIDHIPQATYVNLYGPTEITCNCTYHIVDKKLNYEKQIPIGKAFENEQVFLLNSENEQITTSKEIGEICVKGTALALGYYKDMEQTKEKFIQNPLNDKYIDLIYKTGDLGFFDEKNNLYFAGRKDFQIKHMGHRIELEEIEESMQNIEEIKRACCIYKEEKSKICAFYIGDISKQELNLKLKKILPIYMLPNILTNLEEFPMNKNGKIDRKKLKEMI